MKALRLIPALGAFFVLAAFLAGCGSSNNIPSTAVVSVAGNPISTQAINHWMYVEEKSQAEQTPGQPVIVPEDPPDFPKCVAQVRASIPSLKKTATKTVQSDCKQLFTSLSGQILQYLIQSYWYQATAHKLGISVPASKIDADIAKAKTQAGIKTAAQYTAFLAQSGETDADVRFRILISDIYAKLLARHATKVTPAAISAYYAAHKSTYGKAESLNMRIVLAKTSANAQAAKAALAHGQSWTTVAKKYSIDPTTKNSGGLLSGVTPGQQDQALSKAAFAAPLNKLVGPVKGQFGYYIVEVIKKIPATQETLAQATPQIKSTLSQQKQSAAATAVTDAAEKAWKPKTKCRQYYAMADCVGYKAPKTSTTAAAGAATGGATATAPASTSASASSSSSSSSASSSSSGSTSKTTP